MNERKLGGSEKAFTLIELLVVVGITGVIAAILLPVFFAARERGRRTQCLSNERQLGMAILQYAADNNETLFVAGADGHGFGYLGAGLGWAGRCYPYVKDAGIFRCPNDSTLNIPAGGNGDLGGYAMYAVSYGFNKNLAGIKFLNPPGIKPSAPMPAATLGQIDAPARVVLLFEVSNIPVSITDTQTDGQSAWGNAGAWQTTNPCGHVGSFVDCTFPGAYSGVDGLLPLYVTGNMGGVLLNGATIKGVTQPGARGSIPRHGDGANYLICDGHVVWLRPEQVSPGASAGTENSPQSVTAAAGTADTHCVLTFSSK